MAMRTPENIEKTEVKKYLDSIAACHRWPVPSGYGRDDIDCHASILGIFWAIETKRPGEEPTPRQWRTLREWEKSGACIAWGTATKIIAEIKVWLTYKASRSVRSS
jgi:hypothetical protein